MKQTNQYHDGARCVQEQLKDEQLGEHDENRESIEGNLVVGAGPVQPGDASKIQKRTGM